MTSPHCRSERRRFYPLSRDVDSDGPTMSTTAAAPASVLRPTAATFNPVPQQHQSKPSTPPAAHLPAAVSAHSAHAAPALIPQWPPYAGYPLHLFTSAVDDEFLCIHCRQVLRVPLELPCEHLICRACHTTSPSSAPLKCPVCHAAITEPPHLNKPMQSLIHKLVIACPYKQYGCTHTTAIGKDEWSIQQHIEQCSHAPTVCEGCNNEVQRGHKQKHDTDECKASKWQCELCGEWVGKSEEESEKHRLNTFDRSLLCCHLRPCPNACTLPKAASSSVSATITPASARPHKRQREEETDSAETEEADTAPPCNAGVRTALPFWQMPGHMPVCPLAPVTCAVCSTQVQRRDIIPHFASFHPLKAMRVENEVRKVDEEKQAASAREEEQMRENAEKGERRLQEVSAVMESKQQEWDAERSAQRDSIQQLRAARQAQQHAIDTLQTELISGRDEVEQLRRQLQHLQQQHQQQHQQQQQQQLQHHQQQQQARQQQSTTQHTPPTAPHPQHLMNVDLLSSCPNVYFDQTCNTSRIPYTPPSNSSPSSFSLRLSTFQTTLNGLLCTHCLQPRFQLTQPGVVEPCSAYHPSERMLSVDGRYTCCSRVKGSAGCQQRAMHTFDFDALQREYPEFRDKCHNVRASTSGVTSGRVDASAMQV